MLVGVLVVGTGNVSASAMAERLLAQRFGDVVRVSSAGTRALAGRPMTARSAAAVRSWGADPDGHAARQLDDDLLVHPDLVLTATRAHRTHVVARAPRLLRRTFTLAEAGRLAERCRLAELVGEQRAPSDPAERMRDLATSLVTARGRWPARAPEHDDVEDPCGAGEAVHARAATAIRKAVDGIASAVFGLEAVGLR
ncbi:MAG: hypothetical protein PGN11_10905 [Quadrisphaera sp.]